MYVCKGPGLSVEEVLAAIVVITIITELQGLAPELTPHPTASCLSLAVCRGLSVHRVVSA